MPGQHSEDTKLLGTYVKKSLRNKVVQVLEGRTSSQFLRDAVVEYMERRGVNIAPDERTAPDRTGKGGPVKYKIHRGPRKPLGS